MKKTHLLYYALMVVLNMLPVIPLSGKGILGLISIVISCTVLSYKDGLLTAALWIILGFANFFLGINVDYKYGMPSMLSGTVMYCITAYYLGSSIEKLRTKNIELEREIQRRKEIERILNESLTLARGFMDTIPSPVFLVGMDCKYIKCNRAFENAVGFNENDLKEKKAMEIFPGELARLYNEMEHELLEGEGVKVYESAMSFANVGMRNIILSGALLKDTSGKSIGIVGVITDITDKKESEMLKKSLTENKAIIDEIMKSDKLRTEFFANISHEIRTPLNVILGSVQLIELYFKSDMFYEKQAKITRNIAIMRQNCYRLLRLVNNLIDITKIDASSFEIQLKNCNIVSIIEDITLSVSEYVSNKGINLVFDTDIEEKIMACDAEKIERIMLNLLSNSIKFTPMDGCININVCDISEGVRIQVSDSGIGIPQDKQQKIFQRFCQIDNLLSRQHEGSGIGLNLVKSLVEMHGGTISFKSEFEKGTIFTIDLPAVTVSEVERQSKPAQSHDHVERIQIEFSDIYSVC